MTSHEDLMVGSGAVGEQLRVWRDELRVAPRSEVRSAHLAAMETALTEKHGGSRRVGIERARGRRLRGFAVPIAATVGVLGLTCGLAAAGDLPGPAQRQVSRMAGAVGWEIPGHSGPRAPSGRPEPHGDSGSAPAAPTTAPVADPSSGSRSQPTASTGGASPASSGTVRGRSSEPAAGAPGSSGSAPGHGGDGSSAVTPGSSGAAPGRTGSTPGLTGSTPGQSGSTPGRPASAPGQSGASPGQSGATPGSSARPPGTQNPEPHVLAPARDRAVAELHAPFPPGPEQR